MATLRELKGRIGSVASSEKITGAMKMISSAKMHKAEGALRRLVPFRSLINDIIANLLSSDATFASPLVAARHVRHATIIVWGSDDGLCGAYNANIAKQLANYVAELRKELDNSATITIVPIGRKMVKACNAAAIGGVTVAETPENITSKTDGADVVAYARSLQQDFASGLTDRIDIAYMSFKTAGRQRFTATQYLPVLESSLRGTEATANESRPYIFEPDAAGIFDSALPMFLMATMQQVFTENRASEQAARIMAMQSANDNAKKLLEQLQLEYNKLRQQSITTELLDIVGGQVRD